MAGGFISNQGLVAALLAGSFSLTRPRKPWVCRFLHHQMRPGLQEHYLNCRAGLPLPATVTAGLSDMPPAQMVR